MNLIARLCCSSTICLSAWLASGILYFSSLYMTERWQAVRKAQCPLHDRGFECVPRVEWLVYVTDGIGVVGAVFLTMWILGDDDIAALAVRQSLVFSTVGYVVSSTLHSVTLMPGTSHAAGFPMFGGDVDKLLSNHTFHFGLFLRILVIKEDILQWWPIPLIILIYSVMLIATRGHYTVDIVLAWWGILLVFAWVGLDLPDTSVCSELFVLQ